MTIDAITVTKLDGDGVDGHYYVLRVRAGAKYKRDII